MAGGSTNTSAGAEVVQPPASSMGDTSFTGDTSFMSEGARADETIMNGIEGEEEAEAEGASLSGKAKSSDLEKSLDVMLGRLKGLKRKVSTPFIDNTNTIEIDPS